MIRMGTHTHRDSPRYRINGIQPHLNRVRLHTITCCNLCLHMADHWRPLPNLIPRVLLYRLRMLKENNRVLECGSGKEWEMSTQVPYLSRLGIYRISIEKQETLIKLMVLSTCAILCKRSYFTSVLGAYSFEPSLKQCMCSLAPIAFSTRLFAVLRFESVIHEFDP